MEPRFDQLKDKVEFFNTWDTFPLENLNLQFYVLVVDDVYNDRLVPQKGLLLKLCTVTIRHASACLILPLHNFFTKQIRDARELVLNANLYIFLNSPQMKSMAKFFAQQYFGPEAPRFFELYDNIVADSKFKHLVYDARCSTLNDLRCLSDFARDDEGDEDDFGPIYYVPIKKKKNSAIF